LTTLTIPFVMSSISMIVSLVLVFLLLMGYMTHLRRSKYWHPFKDTIEPHSTFQINDVNPCLLRPYKPVFNLVMGGYQVAQAQTMPS